MKKSPASKKGSKTYVVSGDRKSKEGKTTKVYRKDGSLKSERNVKDAGTKKETRYSASPRTLTRSKKQVDVKDPATRSYTKYKKDGTVKKSITVEDAANKRGTGVDVKVSRKINRKVNRDKRGAKNMTFKQDQRKDVDVERTPAKLKKSPTKMKKSPSKLKSPAKKPLVGKQKNLPEHLKKAILDAPAKMLSKSGMKMMKDGAPTKMKAPMKKSKQKVEQDYARNAIADYKAGKKKEANYEKKKALEVAAGESMAKMKKPVTKTKTTTASGSKIKAKLKNGTIKVKSKPSREAKKEGAKGRKFVVKTNQTSLNPEGGQTLSDPNKYKSRRAAMKKSPSMMKNPMMMKTNQSGGGYAAKNPAAPARQLKKLGSILSKHMKSN